MCMKLSAFTLKFRLSASNKVTAPALVSLPVTVELFPYIAELPEEIATADLKRVPTIMLVVGDKVKSYAVLFARINDPVVT